VKRLLRGFRTAYRVSRWSERRFTLAGRTVAAVTLAAGVLAVDTTRTVAYQVFALGLALLSCAWVLSLRWRPGLAVVRRLPATVTVGVPMRYTVGIDRLGAGTIPDFAVQDALADAFPDDTQFRAARHAPATNAFDRRVGYPRWLSLLDRNRGARIPPAAVAPPDPRGHAEALVELVPLRRGWLQFEALRLLRPDPLGLVNAIDTTAAPASLLALPPVHPVPPIAVSAGRRHRPAGAAAVPQVGDSQEFLQLRDYRPGDPVRRIHWPSTARSGRLVVKETGEEYLARLGLVLDTFVGDGEGAMLDAAVSVAASLAAGLRLGDALLDVLFVEQRMVTVTAGRPGGGIDGVLRELALAGPAIGSDFAVLGEAVRAHAPSCAACLHVFLQWDEPRAALVQSLHGLGLAQLVLVVGAIPGARTVDGVPLHRVDVDDIAASLAAMPVQCG
jgi:uncharacterized protein (DUF58 family)